MTELTKQELALVASGELELPDETIVERLFVQTFQHGQRQIRKLVFDQGQDGRWYYTFRGTKAHYGQFRGIMAAYGIRDVLVIEQEQEAATLAAEKAERVRLERRSIQDWQEDLAALKQNAMERYGREMGGLLSQGLEEHVIGVAQYLYLVPPLHRRVIHAVRLTVRSAVAYMSALFNSPGDKTP